MEETAAILDRVNSGETVQKIAKSMDRHAANIYRLLTSRYGIKFPPKGSRWSKTIRLPSDPHVIGYIAGIIDGEGSILRRKDGHWTVTVGMTCTEIIDFLCAVCGTSSAFKEKPATNRKGGAKWTVARSNDVLAILQVLEPHLILKRSKAQECIAALSSGTQLSNGHAEELKRRRYRTRSTA